MRVLCHPLGWVLWCWVAAVDANPSGWTEQLVARAFVDPADPSRIMLAQPEMEESQRLHEPPK